MARLLADSPPRARVHRLNDASRSAWPDPFAGEDGEVLALHVDRGGTFTDLVAVVSRGGRRVLRVAKVPSDRAVVGALGPVAAGAALTFGTTVATNALLERAGKSTLLVVTEGFEDLVVLRDMRRPELFALDVSWPASLATAVVGVTIDQAGHAVMPATWPMALTRFECAVVALVNTDDDAAEEERLAGLLRAVAPWLSVVVGHAVSPDPGYLARIETALVDAALSPVLSEALVRDRISTGALAVRSDGTSTPAYTLRACDAVLSGPAPGVLAVSDVGRRAGLDLAIGLDMGGTSTDVCIVGLEEGPRRREGELEVAGVRLFRPMLEVDTIAAGGGSILACDGGLLTIGPRSAGADPGPQCYGRGGPPTVTDAALVMGLVDPARFPLPMSREAVALPRPAGSSASQEALAQGYLEVAREAMARAIERLAMARGVALRPEPGRKQGRVGLIAYGGAGAQHAAFVAERLGVHEVIVHPAASVFCALGQLMSERAESSRQPMSLPLEAGRDGSPASLSNLAALAREAEVALVSELRGRGPRGPDTGHDTVHDGVVSEVVASHQLECGHVGSSATLTIAYAPGEPADRLLERFAAAHRARFSFVRSQPVEVRALVSRVAVVGDNGPVDMGTAGLGLPDGEMVSGPTVLFGDHTAIAVPTGWRASSRSGLVYLERTSDGRSARGEAGLDPIFARAWQASIWQSRLMAIAEQGGVELARLAQSVSIKERLDFSCALFDPKGALVVNAPHIPVHLGAMGDTVRSVLASLDPATVADGDAWLSNDPAAGGSHLPDLTVVTAIAHDGHLFFAASRGHHVDVGGLTPGSMPTRSRHLADEGFVVRNAPLVARGGLRPLAGLVAGSRQPEVVVRDLEAQLAANALMARRLVALADAQTLLDAMALVTTTAEEATRRFIATWPVGQVAVARDDLDAIPLAVAISRPSDERRLILDFSGCGGPHAGNLNAPRAVVRAAVLYALRVAGASAGAPLNEGVLAPIELVLPSPSVVAPPPGAAIVGGNVETSQRLVDLVLGALGLRAPSAGTMSNLVIAGVSPDGRPFSSYETLGAGLGASPDHDGASGLQTHMTNTRATDPEVLARRLPLMVRRFAIRRGSGGLGARRGGDGLVRELEVRVPCTASLLAAWREHGAPGVAGGGPGAPGRAFVARGAGPWTPWDGEAVALAAGDRVAVHTPGGGGWGTPPSDPEPAAR